MPSASHHHWGAVPLLAGLLAVTACDPPPSVHRSKDDTLLRHGAREPSTRDPVADAALGDAKVVVLKDGTVEIYDRNGELRAQVVDPQARFVATLAPMTGAPAFSQPHPDVSVALAGLSDWLTRRGEDRRARAALEADGLSESQRVMTAIATAAEHTERQLAALDDELAELWADTSTPASERRRVLFERWDECEEGVISSGPLRVTTAVEAPDALRGQAGARARLAIEAFVRMRLPAGSGDAFGSKELHGFNARRKSVQPFAPYRSETSVRAATEG